jgi:uncharacterized protein YqjF (DUF2071 family)
MKQTWTDLLFAHWPIDPGLLRPRVPNELPLDTFDGRCWIAVAPFRMSGIRARCLPPIPGLSSIPELNVRTYVTLDGKPGVYFFSLDTPSAIAVWTARTFYRLPYFRATMAVNRSGDTIHYSSNRLGANAEFQASYGPIAPVQPREKGTLEHWLTERYCLYTVAKTDICRAEIHHSPWPLQDAVANIEVNTMTRAAEIAIPQLPPLLHFSQRLEVLVWPLKKVR